MAKANTQSARTKKQENIQISWAQAVRDMVVAAINKGQLPIFGFFLVILMLIYKMPEGDVAKLVFEMLSSLKKGEFVAYILLILSVSGWIYHARIMRREFSIEAKRIGREKSNLQSQLAGVKFISSDQQ